MELTEISKLLDRAVFKGATEYGHGIKLTFEKQGVAYDMTLTVTDYGASIDAQVAERR